MEIGSLLDVQSGMRLYAFGSVCNRRLKYCAGVGKAALVSASRSLKAVAVATIKMGGFALAGAFVWCVTSSRKSIMRQN